LWNGLLRFEVTAFHHIKDPKKRRKHMMKSVRKSRILAGVIGGLAIFALILPFASAAEQAGETAPKDDIR